MDNMDKQFWIGWTIGVIGTLIGIALARHCSAGELYVVSTVKSYHQDRQHGYNEKNGGIGLELHINEDVRLIVGEYKNSFYHKSEYAGVAYMPFHRWNLSVGALVLEVSGYNKDLKQFSLIAIPAISYNRDLFEVNIVVAPPIFKMGMVGVQVGWRVWGG